MSHHLRRHCGRLYFEQMGAKRDRIRTEANPKRKRPAQREQRLLVFHINDSTDDQVLFQAACKKAGVPLEWQVADSSARAKEFFESMLSQNSFARAEESATCHSNGTPAFLHAA